LVSVVSEAQQAVVIEDTDIARQRLANVPLSRFHNLLAVPLPRVQGILVVARDEDAFEVTDMQSVAEVGEQAQADLAAALLLRTVADALHRFAERRQL
jgi:hypothetical protein